MERKKKITKKKDDGLMTKQEYFAMLDKSILQANENKTYSIQPNESIDNFIDRLLCI